MKYLIFLLYSLCFISVTLIANGIGSIKFDPFEVITFLYQIDDKDLGEFKSYLDRSLEKIKKQEDSSNIITATVIEIFYLLNRTNIVVSENQSKLDQFIEIISKYIKKLNLEDLNKLERNIESLLPDDFKYRSMNAFYRNSVGFFPKYYTRSSIINYLNQAISFIRDKNRSLNVEGFLASHPIDLPEYLTHATFNDIINLRSILNKNRDSDSTVIDEIQRLLLRTDIIFSDELFLLLEDAIYVSRHYLYKNRGFRRYKSLFRNAAKYIESEVFWEEFAQKTHPFNQYTKAEDYHWLYGKLSPNESNFFDFLGEYRKYLRSYYKNIEIKDSLKHTIDNDNLSQVDIFEVISILKDLNRLSLTNNENFYHISELYLQKLSKLLLETDITLKRNSWLLRIIIKVIGDTELHSSSWKRERSIKKFYKDLPICHPYINLNLIEKQYPNNLKFSQFFSLCADTISYLYKDLEFLNPTISLNQHQQNQDLLELFSEDFFSFCMEIESFADRANISDSLRSISQKIIFLLSESDFLFSPSSTIYVDFLDRSIKKLHFDHRIEILLHLIEEISIKFNHLNTLGIVETPSIMSEQHVLLRIINNFFRTTLRYRSLNEGK